MRARMVLTLLGCCLAVTAMTSRFPADVRSGLRHEWDFVPIYMLEGRAQNSFGRDDLVETQLDRTKLPSVFVSPALDGIQPRDMVPILGHRSELSNGPFTVEAWVLEHVNTPIGFLAAPVEPDGEHAWSFSYFDGTVRGWVGDSGAAIDAGERWHAWWRHLTMVYDGEEIVLYANGSELGRTQALRPRPAGANLGLWFYAPSEPGMIIGNAVRELRLYDRALAPSEIKQRFAYVQAVVNEGVLYDDRFHFTCPPKLQHPTQTSMKVLVETDRPSRARLEYGKTASLGNTIASNGFDRLHSFEISGLEPGGSYFYRVVAEADGNELDSGVLTFMTQRSPEQPFVFAAWADTETRQHVNDRVAKLAWIERPDFVLNGGDLTDGGQRGRRFEWTHEYLASMGQLYSRVPVFSVPGNGESDLSWYRHYHLNPDPENYYTFTWGNAQFFMLDSNLDLGPGSEQYAWLDRELGKSRARWRIVMHHHPTYSSDEDDYGDRWKGQYETDGDPNVQHLNALYQKHIVDIVFYGHLHTYERSWPIRGDEASDRGVLHLQVGGAGGNLENAAPQRQWSSAAVYRGHHLAIVRVNGDRLEFKAIDIDGRIRDSFTLRKDGRGWGAIH